MVIRSSLLSILVLAPSVLFGHVRLLFPTPRTSLALKTGPCGGIARTDKPLVLQVGQDLEVEWEEYVDHPGYYQILFSHAGDADFVVLLDNIPDRPIPVGSGSNIYKAVVQMPDVPCEEGTLQLIQYMTEIQPPRLYFSCADIRLVESSVNVFRRGDVNLDGKVDISDGVKTFQYLFGGDPELTCLDAADSNDDGRVDISDGISTLNFLFGGGVPLATPGSQTCGEDLTEDDLDCALYSACNGP